MIISIKTLSACAEHDYFVHNLLWIIVKLINTTGNTMTTRKRESKAYEDLDHFYSVREEQVNKPNIKLITVLSLDIGFRSF